jgi:hypothetical protein
VSGENNFDASIVSEYARQSLGGVKCKPLFGETLARHSTSIMPAVSGINHHNRGTGHGARRNREQEQEEQRNSDQRQISHRASKNRTIARELDKTVSQRIE